MALKQEGLRRLGATLLSLVMDGVSPGVPATRQDLDDWIAAPPVAHSAVIDVVGAPGSFVDEMGIARHPGQGKDEYFTIDLRTMTIVDHIYYDISGALAGLAARAAADAADGGP